MCGCTGNAAAPAARCRNRRRVGVLATTAGFPPLCLRMVSLMPLSNRMINTTWLASAVSGTGIGFIPLDDADQEIEEDFAFGGRKRRKHSVAEATLRGVYALI